MSAYFLVQFVPDPFIETAITVGALVEVHGAWQFVTAHGGENLLPQVASVETRLLFCELLSALSGLTPVIT